jgi:hypothetical protein
VIRRFHDRRFDGERKKSMKTQGNHPLALGIAAFLAGVGLTVALTSHAAPVAPAAPPADVLRARKFELTDAAGKVRLTLAVRDNGSAGATILDEKGRERLSLFTAPESGSPGVLLKGRDGKPKMVLSTSQETDSALVVMFGRNGKPFPIQPPDDTGPGGGYEQQ